MGRCRICSQESDEISARLGVCGPCIRERWETVAPEIEAVHRASREAFGLPLSPPQDPDGKICGRCFHQCRIPEGGIGYCGARYVKEGRLTGGGVTGAEVSYYFDPLPTNCVADWICPGGTGRGYPQYAARPGPEYGHANMAVFYHACNFNCLYCQNWSFKERRGKGKLLPARDLAAAVTDKTTCICYFGGDPTPHLPHALFAARWARDAAVAQGKVLRICWETNGSMEPGWLKPLVESSLENGGIIKMDLKADSEAMHRALTGVSSVRTRENFAALGHRVGERPAVPLLVASTLLVPGYIDLEEIDGLARFIAGVNPEIPYGLLAFYPQFYLNDLPVTSRKLAEAAREVALAAGLKDVRIGNEHLLR